MTRFFSFFFFLFLLVKNGGKTAKSKSTMNIATITYLSLQIEEKKRRARIFSQFGSILLHMVTSFLFFF